MIRGRLLKRLTARLRWFYRDIDTPPILDPDRYFPAYRDLETRAEALRAEALAVFAAHPDVPRFHDILATQARISASDGKNWRMFMVKSFGYTIRDNAAQTPVLARFLAAHPEVTTAALSYLDPGKHIPRHRGPFRGILRYHLCLYAPDCGTDRAPWLAVDDVTIPYQEGAGLLWDDTFAHEVLNPGPNPRIALLLDVRRPVTRLTHRALFRLMMAGGWLHSLRKARLMRVGARG
ncbi:MAG: aspartyl/asparaginyl beta-hydroxylase domain-containing protein [Rhodobacteraceae bacterium]|nr:aspartyl/asparaginyl beta-hydroxylase domain-containing protein [Paracoccaceae bacterium]